MYNILEGIKPYVFVLVACIAMSLIWTVYVNRRRFKLLLSRAKSYRKLRRKGTEVIAVSGYVSIGEVNGCAAILLNFGSNLARVDDVEVYGTWKQNLPNEVKLLYHDGLLEAACFDAEELNNKIHASFMEQARHVFITVAGVYIIWNILSRM